MVCWFLTVCWLFVGNGSLLVVGLLVGFCWLFDGWLLIMVVCWLFVGNGCLLVVGFLVVGGLLVFDWLLVVCW